MGCIPKKILISRCHVGPNAQCIDIGSCEHPGDKASQGNNRMAKSKIARILRDHVTANTAGKLLVLPGPWTPRR